MSNETKTPGPEIIKSFEEWKKQEADITNPNISGARLREIQKGIGLPVIRHEVSISSVEEPGIHGQHEREEPPVFIQDSPQEHANIQSSEKHAEMMKQLAEQEQERAKQQQHIANRLGGE